MSLTLDGGTDSDSTTDFAVWTDSGLWTTRVGASAWFSSLSADHVGSTTAPTHSRVDVQTFEVGKRPTACRASAPADERRRPQRRSVRQTPAQPLRHIEGIAHREPDVARVVARRQRLISRLTAKSTEDVIHCHRRRAGGG